MPKYIKHTLTQKINIRQVITYFYRTFPYGYYDPPETHDFWELIYIDVGELKLFAGDREYTLKKGDMYLHQPNEYHQITDVGENPVRPHVFILTFTSKSEILYSIPKYNPQLDKESREIIKNLISEIPNNPFDTAPNKVLPAIQYNLRQLEEKDEKNLKFASFQYIKAYLELLFINLVRKTTEADTGTLFFSKSEFNSDMCEKVAEYLRKNIYGNVSIEQICHDLNYSKTMMCTEFKKHTGYSVMQYYNNLKTVEAKMLLRSGKYNINQISNLLNYSSPYYFSMQFKKICGMSPSEYKSSLR